MKPAHFNTIGATPEQLAMQDEVVAYLGKVQPKRMSDIAKRFGKTAAFMRPVVDNLLAHERIFSAVIGRGRSYGVRRVQPVAVITPVVVMKPLRVDRVQIERLAELRAHREAYPSHKAAFPSK